MIEKIDFELVIPEGRQRLYKGLFARDVNIVGRSSSNI